MIRHLFAILIFIVIVTLQLLLIGKVGAGDSEAYYYSWTRHLSLSYFDHPAGIAFLLRLSTYIFGDNPFGLRFFSTILINLSLIIIYTIAYIHYRDTRLAIISMVFFPLTPAFLIGGVSASPEPPLIFFSSLSILFFYLYYEKAKDRYIILSAIFLGIAFNFKYSALFNIIGYALILFNNKIPKKRTTLTIITILFISSLPVIIWNIFHSGVSLEYHLIKRMNLTYIPVNILKFVGGQLLYFNPILIIFIATKMMTIYKEQKENIFLKLFLLLLSIAGFVMIIVKDSEPHWSSIAYIPAAIFFAKELNTYRKILSSSLILNILIFTLFLIHLFTPIFTEGILKNQRPEYDITNELFGWEEVRLNIEEIAKIENVRDDDVLLLSNHYTMAGQLTFATHKRYSAACRGKRCNQFTIDDIKDEDRFKLIIFVTDNRYSDIPRKYRDGAIQQKLKIYRGGRVVREFYLYIKKQVNY
ncbi:MAG: ArnT family glycosyltransferase [Myxococcota bacterium]